MKKLFWFVVLVLMPCIMFAQAPDIQWQKCLGGKGTDAGEAIIQTFDGGFAIAGATNSSDGDVSGKHGGGDFWIVKLNASGAIEWQKCFGGDTDDYPNSIIQTADSGFIVAGSTLSNNGDVSGNHGYSDGWIIKLSSAGKLEWQRCYGGRYWDEITSIIPCAKGGFLFVGWTFSNDEGFFSHGNADVWVVKVDSLGGIQWQRLLGGGADDFGYTVIETTAGDYIIGAQASSIDGDVTGATAIGDTWIVKIDSIGTIKWERCFVGDRNGNPSSISKTFDGGYIIGGSVVCDFNCGTEVGDFFIRGLSDAYVIKFNSLDSVEWIKTYGGTFPDHAESIVAVKNGGYIFSGFTGSIDGDISGNSTAGNQIVWVVKLKPNGEIEWQKCLGNKQNYNAYGDYGESIIQCSDGGYAFTGWVSFE